MASRAWNGRTNEEKREKDIKWQKIEITMFRYDVENGKASHEKTDKQIETENSMHADANEMDEPRIALR